VSTSFCCRIGQGAPTLAIQAAFQDAVSRNGLNLQAASGVTRMGNGYAQQLVNAAGAPYLAAVADSAGAGYVIGGAILTAYLQYGGPAGALGYPLGDVTAGGRQLFQNGALAGSPVQLVTGAILAEWHNLGYETGLAGLPNSAVTTFLTFRGTVGNMQSFQNGLILAATSGSLAGQGFLVSGLTLAAYTAGGGPSGNLGSPIGPETTISGLRQQNFEGGYISYAPGASKATEFDSPRQPVITATPAEVRAGSSVHLVIGGFSNGATVKVTQTGQAAFLVTTASGSFTFDEFVPANTPAGAILVTASDTNGTASAQASYTVYSSTLFTVSIVSGNQQTGAPGAMLTQPLVVMVTDQQGNAVAGQSVVFAASPGAQALPATVVTGANGTASANLRMPPSAGITLVTAQTAGKFVTFSAQSSAFSLGNFPTLTQAVSGTLGNGADTIQNKGALLTSVASIIRYYQSLGALPQTNGLASPAALNQFLSSYCTQDIKGNQICDGFEVLSGSTEQTVNLWRVGAFVSNGITVQIEPYTPTAIADLVAAGTPVLLALTLAGNLGSHFVVAFGIKADGTLLIADPNPAFAQTDLNAYLNGFTSAAGQAVQGAVTGAVLLLPQAPNAAGFMVASSAPVTLTSSTGPCGPTLQFPSASSVAGTAYSQPLGSLYFGACSGTSGPYELDAGPGTYNLTFTDLTPNGGRTFGSGPPPASYQIVSNGQNWTLAPLQALISGPVVNAASYTVAIAPGGLISIFGAGLSGATVQVNGQAAKVVAATPFQVNAQIPPTISPGTVQVTVSSANGSAQQSVAVASVAPAVFSISATQAAITNVDNSLNTASNPAKRGSYLIVYATGLGAVSAAGAATTPVSVVIAGLTIPATYAGASSGGTGLNQVNVLLPAAMPPGLALPLYLQQGGAVSNTVTVAIQ
jgi:uncharacterized protein (TIGR03437 family)